MSLLLSALLAIGACDCPTAAPAHFADAHGNALPSLQPCWGHLHAFFGEATPERITVEYCSDSASHFDTRRDAVQISTTAWSSAPLATVAHESSHLGLNRLTRGASNTEPFRFLDEGLAEYLEHVVAGDLPSYREEVLAVAAADKESGKLGFAAMRGWYTYFGRLPNRNLRAYAAGASVIFYLLERFGEEKLRGFFVDLAGTRDLDKSARAKLGLSAARLEADWSEWLKSQRPAVEAPDGELRVMRMNPPHGSKDVPAELREVEVVLSEDMFRRSPLCLPTPCEAGLCYTRAYWKSPRVLAIRAPEGLRAATPYSVSVGVGGCLLEARSGARLPVVKWEFRTR